MEGIIAKPTFICRIYHPSHTHVWSCTIALLTEGMPAGLGPYTLSTLHEAPSSRLRTVTRHTTETHHVDKRRTPTTSMPIVQEARTRSTLVVKLLRLSAAAAAVHLAPLELQPRFGDMAVRFQVNCPQLSPKRDCSPKRVKLSRRAILTERVDTT